VDAFEQFARGGMQWLGLEPSDTDVEIMRYIDMIFGPELRVLMEADMSGWRPENDVDPSRAPSA
jgi:hypothetical protein